jgi:uncharacterized sulfatase
MRISSLLLVSVLWLSAPSAQAQEQRPNVLWITCEDISPHVGCYGDPYAVTPNIDKLATQGVRYTNAFAPIGVCAPSRSTLITGMWACSIGSHHMRCQVKLPDDVKCFPEYLRQAGYYCTNNVKTDYNFAQPASAWDESSGKAHWKNRRAGQPFFSVFNFTSCHESQIRLPEAEYQKRTAQFTDKERHDPAKAHIPPYHPDTPEVRKDWARYADMITYMDKQVGDVLQQLDKDGLAEDTIVFYFSDHGAGMPRSKRWLYDSSLKVPCIVRFPKKYEALAPGKPGTTTDRLVTFADFGPTVLSLVALKTPPAMQGQPFLGKHAAKPREYVYGFRDRMDDRYDMIRAARDQRFKYIRNYHPEKPWFHDQFISYMYEMPTMKVWQRLADEGKLTGPPAIFMAKTRPMEELYDTQADPHEIRNLAGLPEHKATLEKLRAACRTWQKDIIDLGLLPESDLRSRFGKTPEYTAVRLDPKAYPLERIAAAADLANRMDAALQPQLIDLLKDQDVAVRWWGTVGLGSLGGRKLADEKAAVEALRKALSDPSATVRVGAADALCRLNQFDEAVPVLGKALADGNEWLRLEAVNVLDRIDEKARPVLEAIQQAKGDKNQYVVRVVEHTLKDLK